MISLYEEDRNALLSQYKDGNWSGWEGDSYFQYNNWNSDDGTRTLCVSVAVEPAECISKRSVCLIANTNSIRGVMMRAQVISWPDLPLIYRVYLDALVDGGLVGYLSLMSYRADKGGELYEENSLSRPTKSDEHRNLSDVEFRHLFFQEVTKEGIRALDHLPQEIDTEATVQAFMEQIKKRDFSRPALITPTKRIQSLSE